MAREVLNDLRLNPLGQGEQLNFIGLSGGATTAFNAAAILQQSHVQISHLVTLGGVVWEPKPANVGTWTSIVGRLDPLPVLGERASPDQLIVLGDVSHVTLPALTIQATVPVLNRQVSLPILTSRLPGPTRDIPGYLDAFAEIELLYLLVGPGSAVGLE